jgi:hypothetical protein
MKCGVKGEGILLRADYLKHCDLNFANVFEFDEKNI